MLQLDTRQILALGDEADLLHFAPCATRVK
jgi:hypothetical protein